MRFLVSALPLVASIATAAANSEPVSYDGHKVFRIRSEGDPTVVEERLSSLVYDEWNWDANDVTFSLSPDQLDKFYDLGLEYHTMHEDLGRSIREESSRRSEWKRQDNGSWFDSYHDYEDHKTWLEDLQTAYPDNSELVSSGTSYEGRDLFGIHIYGDEGPGKPAVVWHGTVHAREWISAPVVEYLTLQLLSGYGSEEEATAFVDSYDFWIFPFVNPDGFVHTQTTDRMWRKNRQPPPTNATTCYGRDVNRNWPNKWDADPRGASVDPCSQTYKGEAPADTPEMQGMHVLLDELRDSSGIKLFIDWHSFSQFILAPLGWNCTQYVPELGQHINMALRTSRAIRSVEGTQFVFGPSCSVLYLTTGYSVDYAYEVAGAKWAYLIELRDTGDYGFILPPEQIKGSVEEQWAGMKVMLSLLDEELFPPA